MKTIIVLLLIPGFAFTQVPYKIRPIVIPQRDSSRDMQYMINSKVFNNGVTETINLFNVRNGWWLSIPQDTLMLAKYRGLNHGLPDTLLWIKGGNVRMSPLSEFKLPFAQVVGSRTPSTPTRVFGTAFTPSATRDTWVKYTCSITATMTLSGGQSGIIYLETSTNGTTWTEVDRMVNSNSGALSIGLNIAQSQTGSLTYIVPAGVQVRIRSTGTATNVLVASVETLL